jgi:hypothetical protein
VTAIHEELGRLTKDLQVTAKQQQQVRPLLQEHHDRIHALLTDHQKELEKAMQHRGEENRRPE